MISIRSKYFVRILVTQVLLMFVLSGLFQLQSLAQSVSFVARRDFTPGGSGASVADMNNDGKADVIMTDGSTATVSVRLGKGDGTFQTPIVTNFTSGLSPFFLAIADINVDGKPDLVTLSQFSSICLVLPGRGDGTFESPINVSVDFQVGGIAVGDFNGDGIPDLATTSSNFPGGTVSVSPGNGDGTFGPRQSFPVGNSPASVSLGDLNGDGKLDVAVANVNSNSVSVLMGVGDGSLLPAINIAVDGSPRFLTITDFDGDCRPDLAVVLSSLDEISILLGNGDGTFLVPLNVAVSQNPVFMTPADFNGDQIPDLVIAHSFQTGSVSILLGIGDGSFQSPVSYALSGSPAMLDVGDFNGDGFRDVVVSQPSVSFSSVSILSEFLGRGDGTFQSAMKLNTSFPNSMVVADFDGNGILDLAVDGGNFSEHVLSIFMGNGDGTFHAGTSITLNFSSGSSFPSPVVGDFNHDQIIDLAVATSSIISVLLGKGDGTFQPPQTLFTNISATSLAVADFNSDGNPDLAAGGSDFGPGMMVVFLANGDGTFQSAKSFTTANPIPAFSTGEFNGDGRPDLVIVSPNTNSVGVFLGNGDGTFSQLSDIPVGRIPIAVAVGDLNGDGLADIVAANSNSNNVSILLGNGHSGFQAAFNFAVVGNPSSLMLGDFNNDKRLDVAVSNSVSNTVAILLNTGTAIITKADEVMPYAIVRTAPAAYFGVGTNPAGLVAGDFNNDHLLDLVSVDRGSNGLSVLTNNTKIPTKKTSSDAEGDTER